MRLEGPASLIDDHAGHRAAPLPLSVPECFCPHCSQYRLQVDRKHDHDYAALHEHRPPIDSKNLRSLLDDKSNLVEYSNLLSEEEGLLSSDQSDHLLVKLIIWTAARNIRDAANYSSREDYKDIFFFLTLLRLHKALPREALRIHYAVASIAQNLLNMNHQISNIPTAISFGKLCSESDGILTTWLYSMWDADEADSYHFRSLGKYSDPV
ncbi:hypothetical protein PGT21_003186 [Puccinia graminis f. sp. tritici]|uniref:Uncharacterized protein n=1 Tax=Puccinia graminis f. sp. tritici TaxID=56615 RepID=A0A5B0LSL8_PUCGR|nr:hypothetical protein PGT21_003186 [Puccinia graminis f. sp. tritici]